MTRTFAAAPARKTTVALRKSIRSEVNRAIAATKKVMDAVEAGVAEAGTTYVKNDITYVINASGVSVRVPTKDKLVTREEVVYLLRGVRAVDVDEALTMIGEGCLKFMLENDLLRRDAKVKSLLHITRKAGEKYGLPRPVICDVVCDWVK